MLPDDHRPIPSTADERRTPPLRRIARLATVDAGPLRRHRDYRLLFLGRAVSLFGKEITDVAVPFQIYTVTHSSFAVGLLGLFVIGPTLVMAFVGGALADAHDRRRMVQLTEIGLLLLSLVLVVNALLPWPRLWVLYTVAAGIAALSAVQRPALDGLLPRVVTRDELTAAAALNSVYGTTAMIAGPALAGILIVVIGLPGTFAVDVATTVIALGALRLMRASPAPPDAERPSLRSVLEGVRYARSRADLLGTYLVDMVAMFFGMPLALFPALAVRFGGAGVLGLLYAAPAVGALAASVTSGWTRHVHRHGVAIVLAAGGWGLAVIGFGLSPTLPAALTFLALAGAADEVSALFRSTIWNATIPDQLRGRLAGIELISYSSGPALGNVEAGVVASTFSLQVSIVSGGILCVAGVGLLAAALPALLRYDNRTAAPAAAPSA